MALATRGLLVVLPLLALAGCTASGAVVTSGTASASYEMPLASSASPSSADGRTRWTGAAGQVVQCAGPVVGSTTSAPFDGEDAGTSPQSALEAAKKGARWSGAQEGFVLARVETDRRLYVFEVDGVAKQALILRHGPALKGDGTTATVTRWWLESWARCDYSEMPEFVARERGLQIWTGADGKRQLTSTIVSFDFGGDCYSGMSALDVGGPIEGDRNAGKRVPAEYVRHPAPELREEYFQRDYAEHVTVPADAVDSGFEHDGEHLWFSKDRGYAYVGTTNDAEAWPRAAQPIRCA